MIKLLVLVFIGLVNPVDKQQERDTLAKNRLTAIEKTEYISPERVSELIYQGTDSVLIPTYFTDRTIRNSVYQNFASFYKNRNYQLAWLSLTESLPQTDSLLQALKRATEEGLDFAIIVERARRLQRKTFKKNPDRNKAERLVKLDFLLTSAYMTYGSQLLSGKLDPLLFDSSWHMQPRKKDLGLILESALQENNIHSSLLILEPQHEQFKRLKEALSGYKKIAEGGGWQAIPLEKALQKGDTSALVVELRKRMALTGDLELMFVNYPQVFDERLENAVKQYQDRYGLEPTGIATLATIQSLNVPVEHRMQQIRINMERIRWWPDSLGERYVMVNIPDYKLWVVENGDKVMEMKVIVGEEYNSTPIFRDTIEYVEFNPTWTVPLSIARAEILPILKGDPGYLASQNFKLYDGWNPRTARELNPHKVNWKDITAENFNYRLVQQPGGENPLGSVKFMFPNDLQVYIHDTPDESLFKKDRRTFSHGCIRVERPLDLAAFLLQKENKSQVEGYLNRGNQVVERLSRKVPIQFSYQTVVVDDSGKLHFLEDIYKHDSSQIEAVSARLD